ncbi:MAG: ribonuclease HI family protein, partial [Chloroflexota bacterium]
MHPLRGLHQLLPLDLVERGLRRAGRHRQRPPLHLRLARRGGRGTAGDPGRPRRRLAVPDHLQLHRCLPAGDQHHGGHPGGLPGHRGASRLSEPTGPGTPLRLVIRTDGAARGNPGAASCGAVLIDASRRDALDPDAPPLVAIAKALGRRTNNVAEYAGLIMALRAARRLGAVAIDLRLDSRLIVEQLNGRWRVRDAKIARLYEEARRLLVGFESWHATHEPRARNRAADRLANLALDDPHEAARYVEAVGRA